MDWRKELEEIIGNSDEKTAADLTDMEGREVLDERHLNYVRESCPENMDVAAEDSTV